MLYGMRSLVGRLGLWGMEGEAGDHHHQVAKMSDSTQFDSYLDAGTAEGCRVQVAGWPHEPRSAQDKPRSDPVHRSGGDLYDVKEAHAAIRFRYRPQPTSTCPTLDRSVTLPDAPSPSFLPPASSLLRLFTSPLPLLTPVMSATLLYVNLIQPSPLAARYPPSLLTSWRGRTEDLALVRETPITPLLTSRGWEGMGCRDPEVLGERALPPLPP